MKKIYSYLIGISLCLLITALVAAFINRNRIYVWFLGDVEALYKEAMSYYKNRQYDKAFPLLCPYSTRH